VTYKAAASSAQAAGQADRVKRARKKASDLEPKLATLTIVVPAATERADLVVKRDGEVVGKPEYGVPIPVDAASHVVEASAPGRKSWRADVSVKADGDKASIEVPALAEDTSAAPPPATSATAPPPPTATATAPPPPSTPPSSGGTQRTIGIIVGAAGLVGVGVGSFFGLNAMSKNNDAKTHCTADVACDPQGVSLTDDAKNAARISTIAFVAGGVFVAAGAVLWITAPKASPATGGVLVAPMVGAREGGIAVRGGW
jgi:serine/threonine-protein kinase